MSFINELAALSRLNNFESEVSSLTKKNLFSLVFININILTLAGYLQSLSKKRK